MPDIAKAVYYIVFIMKRLDGNTRAQVISCLIEDCSIRSTLRTTGVAKKTVLRALVEAGMVCADYQDGVFKNLSCRRLQLDELWAWIYCKEKNRTEEIAKKHPDTISLRPHLTGMFLLSCNRVHRLRV
jgi:hypothetical protein